MLTVTPLPAFQDNYIWTLSARGRVVIVDPGDAGPVEDFLDRNGGELEAILVTHHHRDHTGGLARLAERTACRVVGPSGVAAVTEVVRGGERVILPGSALEFAVFATPGHTLDHLAYYGARHLFCGDTLFGAGCGRLFEGTPTMMVTSFARLLALPDDTLVCPAHEYTLANLDYAATVDPDNSALRQRIAIDRAARAADRPTLPSTLALEKATNPFLRTGTPALRLVATRDLGRPPHDEAEAFGTLRAHKDRYDAAH